MWLCAPGCAIRATLGATLRVAVRMFLLPDPEAVTPRWVAVLASLVFPERCFGCGVLGPDTWCGACRTQLRELEGPCCPRCGAPQEPSMCSDCLRFEPAFDAAASAYRYDGPLRSIMLAYKYRGYRRMAAPLASCLRGLMQDAVRDGGEVVVPVPSDPIRRWRRGFNPAELIARAAAAEATCEVASGALARKHGGRPQVGIGRALRRSNVAGRFVMRDSSPVSGRNVILVDDVFTTGSTCSEAARVLKNAGAVRVHALTVARD